MSNLIKKYEDFVLHNAPQISGIESGLRSLTYILPGRFNDADMASEAIFATVNLMSLYHDTILSAAAHQQNPEAPTSNFNRYTRHMLLSGGWYKKVAYTLTMVQMVEVLVEMGARKMGGGKGRGRVVLGIEVIKVVCRTALLKLSQNRMLLHSAVPERDYDPSTIHPPATCKPGTWTGKRTGKHHVHVDVITQKGGYDQAVQFLLSKALTERASSPVDLLNRLGCKWAEWAFIFRPLVYVLTLRRYGSKSYKPYLISLTLELGSLLASLHRPQTSLEKDETKRRCWLLLYYLLRNPVYERFTKERLDAFVEGARKRPLISLFAGILRDYQPLWEKWHFYTSGY
ncbi:hypothetical protein SpCBS45565_g06030 [Spizellomyces sp. 'palustris']|nr:hypothetical protein SpCBS45565_g06030 [Spizellomyces sp. 'palustris']